MGRTAWITGASGLVGSFLLKRLLAAPEYERVVALVRRPLGVSDPKLEQREVDFTHLAGLDLPKPDDVFCTLGTTIKKAGSKEAFRRIDYDIPLMLAERAVTLGAKQFLLVTSVASDSSSPNFYLRVKGDLEAAVAALPFESAHFFRPSFLAGERRESRPAERIGIGFARAFEFLLFGPMRIYRAIDAEQVAASMAARALRDEPGRHIHHYDGMIADPEPG